MLSDCAAHMVVIKIVNHDDEAPCLSPSVDTQLGNVPDENGAKMPTELQVVCRSKWLHRTRGEMCEKKNTDVRREGRR